MIHKYYILFGVVILLLSILCGCTDPDRRIFAEKLSEIPEEYFEITEEEINSYPKLKLAIEKESRIKINYEEERELSDLFEEKNTHNIKFGNDFYRIRFTTT